MTLLKFWGLLFCCEWTTSPSTMILYITIPSSRDCSITKWYFLFFSYLNFFTEFPFPSKEVEMWNFFPFTNTAGIRWPFPQQFPPVVKCNTLDHCFPLLARMSNSTLKILPHFSNVWIIWPFSLVEPQAKLIENTKLEKNSKWNN